MEHTPRPGTSTVYHDRNAGVPWLIAFCDAGLPDHHYYPHALDDDIVHAWGVLRHTEIVLYLLPDADHDRDGGTAAGPFPTIDDAHTYCLQRFDGPLRLVWL